MALHFQKNDKNYINDNEYIIYDNSTPIGEIVYKQENNIFIIGFVEVYPQYKNKHYGYQIIDYILNNFTVDCIVGEILDTAKGFWNKCIIKYKGKEVNLTHSENCNSSLIIPEQNIDELTMKKLLEEAYWII